MIEYDKYTFIFKTISEKLFVIQCIITLLFVF